MQHNVDEPRYLARVGYTTESARAIDGLECVDESTQNAITQEAHRRWRAELQRTWGEARSSIVDGVEQFKASGRLDRKLVSDLRLVERGVRALDRDVLDR